MLDFVIFSYRVGFGVRCCTRGGARDISYSCSSSYSRGLIVYRSAVRVRGSRGRLPLLPPLEDDETDGARPDSDAIVMVAAMRLTEHE